MRQAGRGEVSVRGNCRNRGAGDRTVKLCGHGEVGVGAWESELCVDKLYIQGAGGKTGM